MPQIASEEEEQNTYYWSLGSVVVVLSICTICLCCLICRAGHCCCTWHSKRDKLDAASKQGFGHGQSIGIGIDASDQIRAIRSAPWAYQSRALTC